MRTMAILGRKGVLGFSSLAESLHNGFQIFEKTAPGSRIQVRVTPLSGDVMLEITDSGHGMAAGDCDRAFERFYRGTSHGDVEGSYLGLAIAKRAVERAHRQITLTSELGRGTAVRIYLPRPIRAAQAQV